MFKMKDMFFRLMNLFGLGSTLRPRTGCIVSFMRLGLIGLNIWKFSFEKIYERKRLELGISID